jgi:hypothetical protein
MGARNRWPDMARKYTVEEWRDGKIISPPLHTVEAFGTAVKLFNDEVAANPDRYLTMSQGARIVHKHPDTAWKVQ